MESPAAIDAAFLAYRCSRDPAALAVVYDGTFARLLAIALHLSRTPAAAEDAVQETFLFALQHPEQWDETRPVMPWLLGILGNRLRRVMGSERRAPDVDRLRLPNVDDPEATLHANEVLTQIDHAIAHLAEPYRTVVLLRLRSGMNPADIAVTLNRQPSTVRAQLTRGLEMLRKVLPVTIAALLASSLTASPRAGAAREALLQHAARIHDRVRTGNRLRLLRRWSAGLAGCAAVALLTWSVWPQVPDIRVAPSPQERSEVAGVIAETAAAVSLPATSPTSAPERLEVETTGSLKIAVRGDGFGLPHALIEIEPVGGPARAFVHEVTGLRGHWREMVSGRQAAPAELRHAMTADDGAFVFSGLQPGGWICRALDAAEIVRVKAGEVTTLDLMVDPKSTLLTGRVIDSDGRPLPHAPVWQCREHMTPHSDVFAHSDAQGRFAVAVAPFTTIGALREGYAPVGFTLTPRLAAPNLDIELRFSEPGAILEGRLVDDHGDAVAGALVEVGHAFDCLVVTEAMWPQVLARPQRTRSDGEGRFRFVSLVPGEAVLTAGGNGHGVCRQIVDLPASGHLDAVLCLPAMAVIEGRVRDLAGAAVVGAVVRIGRRGGLGHCTTVTDGDGRYRLSGVTPGRPMVEAVEFSGAFACCEVPCLPGSRETWDAVLSPQNLSLSGRVLDARRQPLADGWIAHLSRWSVTVLRLDHEGRFTVPLSEREAALPCSLQVFDRDPTGSDGVLVGSPLAVVAGVLPGADDLEILVPPVAEPTARLRGRILMPSGLPPEGRVTLLGSVGRRTWEQELGPFGSDGSFDTGPIRPSSYLLRIHAAGRRMFGPIEVASNASLDVGLLRPVAEAASERQFHRQLVPVFPGQANRTEAILIEIRDANGWLLTSKRQGPGIDGQGRVYVTLPAGEFELRAISDSGLVAERTIVIDPERPPHRALPIVFRPE
ncbi:MAG: sigma-70 family RNA polymerase sigma factor [Planctomycetes bacterium]|nr:sigma-70 family RNA polymerase sigma factor [Planctomycetota bacterium]